MSDQSEAITMKVSSRRSLTPSIIEFVLTLDNDAELPSFAPGAHITVETPCGAMRRYSLIGTGNKSKQYVIAVKRDPSSRGGSLSMHDDATIGTELRVAPPENEFVLKKASKYLLIAGGIGITPIFAMARQLESAGDDFNIIYCTRNADETAYLDELTEAYGDKILLHFDDGDPEKIYDFWDHFAEPQNMHVYCCGPKPLMEEIKAISGHWPEGRVNFEDFKPVEVIRPNDVAFDVKLAKSGKIITVQPDRSILEAARDAGVSTVSSCESGTCGTCKTRLNSGDVDHRDMVLMDDERKDYIMICVSRARSGDLVIDL